jgi:hypothetical protein
MPHWEIYVWFLVSLILFDAGGGVGDSRGQLSALSCQLSAIRKTRLLKVDAGSEVWEAKKCGVEIGDPNLRFQPRLPGSVVGEASMGQVGKADKITRVTGL